MKKPKLSRFPKQAARRNAMTRSAGLLGRNSQAPLTKLQVVSSMYAYLMTSWDDLPDENKRALGFDFVVGSEGEEVALNHLARLFMDYADLSFRRALVARRRRLGVDE
ncbi:hypothetical protein [Pseudomonas syringae group sp. J309-1]|uniref:hypothetical protein n=1 Tax=Pseudomonas syringae group sp. J309-1 TaxID=3079588 RepID=UPI00290766F6|nr:hypothetical protein [Pseudomonas syringae group sp. J309-1]MDU8359643.1 hypothetical protein [Pseudomonas syringae group sp. J309-1]